MQRHFSKEMSLVNKRCWSKWTLISNNTSHYIPNVNCRWTTDLNMNFKTIKLLEENKAEKNLNDHGLGQDFLNKIPKPQIIK